MQQAARCHNGRYVVSNIKVFLVNAGANMGAAVNSALWFRDLLLMMGLLVRKVGAFGAGVVQQADHSSRDHAHTSIAVTSHPTCSRQADTGSEQQ